MFGSNEPCSPIDFFQNYSNILEPIYFPPSPEPPPTPDIISGLVSLTSPSDVSSCGSYIDQNLTSPEDYGSSMDPLSRVQATRSKLIKEGLKLTIQSRRLVQGLDNVRSEYRMPLREELTKEDEDRRRRRRERNKVAATKCRNKKKERTGRLAEESEALEDNNNALKTELQSLEVERNQLMNLLQGHAPHCVMQQQQQQQQHQTQPQHHFQQQLPGNNYYFQPMPSASWSSVSG